MSRTMCPTPRAGFFSWTLVRNQMSSTKIVPFLVGFILLAQLAPQVSTGLSHRHKHGDVHGRERVRRVGRDSPDVQPHVESLYLQNARVTESYAYKTETVAPRFSAKGNLHKPNFTNCDSYQAEIFEGQPINTTVIQVEAIDLDPYDAGGSIIYTIEDKTEDFTIDELSGLIRTNKIFDRDEPSREKIAYVTVKATDNGRPPLADVCNLKVKILDINDNQPQFDKFDYRESVPRDIALHQVVMRISATDIDDGNNGVVQYRLERHPHSPNDIDFFEIVPETGEVKLKQRFDMKESERQYYLTAIASDKGSPSASSQTNLSIKVVEPNQKPPYFTKIHSVPIRIKERTFNYMQPIATLEARSGIENNSILFFELINGQTQATNKDSIFTQETSGNTVTIKVDRPPLDYELVNEYTLTIRVSNRHDLAATTVIKIEVEDENDEKPIFTDVSQGIVLENEDAGTMVMRVQAIDKDGTSPNNLVTYSLEDAHKSNFQINYATGEIRTRKQFDREEQDVYSVTVIATDGAPSVLESTGRPNERRYALKILIADKNDNAPVFVPPQGGSYQAEIAEDANVNGKVMEVKATDIDSASVIEYSIESGDPDDNFAIQSTTTSGVITVKKSLDYEKVQRYILTIKATDSVHEIRTQVYINVTNVNDNLPEFEPMNTNTTIVEESIPGHCIFIVKAFDPDIGDRTQPQNISYSINIKYQDSFSVDNNGCVRVTKGLDRDLPNGYALHQVFVEARDEWGLTLTPANQIGLIVHLDDINDNAPFYNGTNPVVWNENQPAGEILTLTAMDYDEPKNGAPFTFRLDPNADSEIRSLFEIKGNKLYAIKNNFDREYKKQYFVPILISDNGVPKQQSGVSKLTVIIGDENDNQMKSGESNILVYKYKENTTFTIGRVFVNDLDDWDLPDKVFRWESGRPHNDFNLDYENGYISMKPSARETTHRLLFKVRDNLHGNEVTAGVNVTVRQITEEAVDNSGSIRFVGISKEQFIMPDATGRSKQDRLRAEIAAILDIPEENVDVFTVINPDIANDANVVDVRFSAHNSPFYKPERLDGILGQNKDRLEDSLKLNILMIRVDECIREKLHCGEQSCTNVLQKRDISYKIFTNTSSFVGVDAYIAPVCQCMQKLQPSSCHPNPCLYDGICHAGPTINGYRCECREGYRGRRCELTSISFDGTGWAWYPPLSVCDQSNLDVYFKTLNKNGLLMYNGPIYKSTVNVTDFMSLELSDGRPVLLMDFGSGILRLQTPTSLDDGKDHLISLRWSPIEISMSVDECVGKPSYCHAYGQPQGTHTFLNVNGPLQVGGMSFHPNELQSAMKWAHIPTATKFAGCISNLSLNGEFYDLGAPSFSLGNVSSCDGIQAEVQVANLGVGISFIIILLVCILVLLILVIAIVFYRRSRKYDEVKGEAGDDVRENIINYSDEGGGEGDQTGYDLSVLMKATNGPYIHSPTDKIPMQDMHHGRIPDNAGPDIQSFLTGSKNKVDNDPDGLPYDDVRNYAYEGDGNSMGSLSSLASGTDDEDLSFDFLPSFGPRFKKLADMYGGESSDDERSSRVPPESWYTRTEPVSSPQCVPLAWSNVQSP